MDETALIQAAQAGDQHALEVLLRSVERPIYKSAYYLLGNEQDASDATQEVLFRVCKKLTTFEVRAGFKTWVLRITSNFCTDMLRKRKAVLSISQIEFDLIEPNAATEDVAVSNVLLEQLSDILNRLPQQVRAVVLLRFVNDWSYQAISEHIGLPINTVKSHIRRTRTILQGQLSPTNHREEVRP